MLLEGGFDDVQLLVNQMRTNLRISESMLQKVGVDKPGHRMRILVKLEEEASGLADRSHTPTYTPFKETPRRGMSQSITSSQLQQSNWIPPRSASPFLFPPSQQLHPVHALSQRESAAGSSSFFECCSRPTIAPAMGMSASTAMLAADVPTLRTWLGALKLSSLHHFFVVSGYDCLLSLLKQMGSSYPMSDEILRRDIGVTKLGHRSRLLSKLHEGKGRV